MRRFLTLFALTLALTPCTNAQPALRDSLLKRLVAAKEDSATVRLYLRIGDMTENTDAPKAREYYSKAIALSSKLRDTIKIIQALNFYGGSFMVSGQADSLLYYTQQALPLARQIKNLPLIGQCLFNMGLAYRDLSDFDNAIKYCLEGKPLLEANSSIGTLIEINDALQGLYTAKTAYDKGIFYGEIAVRLSREANNKPKLAQTLINLSMPYTETNRLEKALSLLQEARQLADELRDDRIILYVIMNLANVSIKREDFATTKKYSEEALPLERKVGAEEAKGTTLRALALCYIQEKNYAKAKESIDQSLVINKRLNNIREEAAGLRVLSSIHFATGDVRNGYRISIRGDSILEKMVTDQLTGKATELEKKYETEKKETRIRELEIEKKIHQLTIRQKSTLNYVLIGSAAFLAILSVLLVRNYRQKQRLHQRRIIELETEKRLTATEAVLKGEEQERTRLAQELHDGLGGMLSGIKYSFKTMQGNLIMTPDNVQAFERSMDMLDSSIKEMRRVAHNMMPEALVKFGLDAAIRDFCNDITRSGALQVSYVSLGLENMIIEQTMAITIYRIVQELLNNTMKHAGARTAIVQVAKSGSQLAVTVEDNGKGFDTRLLQQAEGIGWTNIRNRVEFLNGQLNVQSEDGKGTSVHIELPV